MTQAFKDNRLPERHEYLSKCWLPLQLKCYYTVTQMHKIAGRPASQSVSLSVFEPVNQSINLILYVSSTLEHSSACVSLAHLIVLYFPD